MNECFMMQNDPRACRIVCLHWDNSKAEELYRPSLRKLAQPLDVVSPYYHLLFHCESMLKEFLRKSAEISGNFRNFPGSAKIFGGSGFFLNPPPTPLFFCDDGKIFHSSQLLKISPSKPNRPKISFW